MLMIAFHYKEVWWCDKENGWNGWRKMGR